MMAYDEGLGELLVELAYQFTQCLFLLRCAGVSSLSLFIKSTFVADADAMAVVQIAVGTHLRDVTTFLDGAVAPYDIVVANALPSPVLVPFVNVFGRAPLSRTDSRAMNDNQCNRSHQLIHDVAPKAVATAARMLINICMAYFNIFFFIIFHFSFFLLHR